MDQQETYNERFPSVYVFTLDDALNTENSGISAFNTGCEHEYECGTEPAVILSTSSRLYPDYLIAARIQRHAAAKVSPKAESRSA
jgi:hypothetical protein